MVASLSKFRGISALCECNIRGHEMHRPRLTHRDIHACGWLGTILNNEGDDVRCLSSR